MSTIGYGDISPSTDTAKCIAIVYLPLAVIALADAISDIQMIGTRRSIRETDFGQTADECLLRDSVRDGAPANIEPVLTEAEFLIDQLLANELVDEAAVVAVRRQFKHLTRRGKFKSDDDRKLTPKLVYEEIRERAQGRKPLSSGATAKDVTPEGRFRWKSYEEWLTNSWQPRVYAMEAEIGGADDSDGAASGYHHLKDQRMAVHTAVGAMRR